MGKNPWKHCFRAHTKRGVEGFLTVLTVVEPLCRVASRTIYNLEGRSGFQAFVFFLFFYVFGAQVCEGQANGFSSDFIAIEIESPDCPDLTLIDLPGIVRTAVSGQSQGVITEVGRCSDMTLPYGAPLSAREKYAILPMNSS